MSIENSIKASPIYWLSGIVATSVALAFGVDARYAKAGDVTQAKEELKQEMIKHRSYTDAGFLQQRKSSLQDKVFELEAKREEKKLGEVELRLLIRYRAELEDVNRDLRTKR